MSEIVIGDIGSVSTPGSHGLSLEELRDRVFAVLRDQSRKFIGEPAVDAWLNEAQLDLAHRQRVLRREYAGTYVGSTIVLPKGAFEILEIEVPDGTEIVSHHSHDDVFGSHIEVYPEASSDTSYVLTYLKEPTPLTQPDHVSELPPELHPKMVKYAQAQACYKEREYQQGDRYLQMYEDGLSPHPQGRGRAIPVPVSVELEGNYFDSSCYLD